MSPNFQNLKDIIQNNILEKEAEEKLRREEEYSMWRDEIEDAYRAAFDYNPDAEWNID